MRIAYELSRTTYENLIPGDVFFAVEDDVFLIEERVYYIKTACSNLAIEITDGSSREFRPDCEVKLVDAVLHIK